MSAMDRPVMASWTRTGAIAAPDRLP